MNKEILKVIDQSEVESNTQAELQAVETIQEIDPVVKRVNQVYKDIDQIYQKFVTLVKNSNNVDIIGDGFKTLLLYQRVLSSDPIVWLKYIKTLNPDQVELAKALARKGRIMKRISKDKDPNELFGKK